MDDRHLIGNLSRSCKRDPIRDPRVGDRCFEALAVARARPGGEVAAVGGAADPDAVRIDQADLGQVIDPGNHVDELLTSEVAVIRLGEGHAPASAPAVVGHQHGVTVRGQQLRGIEGPCGPAVVADPLGAAMREDRQRIADTGHLLEWTHQNALDPPTVGALPFDRLLTSKLHLAEPGIMPGQPRQLAATHSSGVDLAGVRRGVDLCREPLAPRVKADRAEDLLAAAGYRRDSATLGTQAVQRRARALARDEVNRVVVEPADRLRASLVARRSIDRWPACRRNDEDALRQRVVERDRAQEREPLTVRRPLHVAQLALGRGQQLQFAVAGRDRVDPPEHVAGVDVGRLRDLDREASAVRLPGKAPHRPIRRRHRAPLAARDLLHPEPYRPLLFTRDLHIVTPRSPRGPFRRLRLARRVGDRLAIRRPGKRHHTNG